jgi:DNA-binding NtrC family response regulator
MVKNSPDPGNRPGSALIRSGERLPTVSRIDDDSALPEHMRGESMPKLNLLLVDDEEAIRRSCRSIAEGMGFLVYEADSVASAESAMRQQRMDVLLLDLRLQGVSALDMIESVRKTYPGTSIVVVTAFATVSSAVEAMRLGAGDYLTKPFTLEDLMAVLERASQKRQFDLESRRLRERLRAQRGNGSLIGQSPAMEKLFRMVSKVAFSRHPVLIFGEAGTGKELVARTIHFNGLHATKPFIPVDCGGLQPALIESELFGHVKGAFQGAARAKDGLLAAADGGTVFLDEIAEMPLELQAKLLRALQEKEIHPIGSTASIPIRARILAATSRDLAGMVEQGKFRKDLYFRLNVVNVRVPALRDRREDIALLAEHFLERSQRETGREHTLSDDALRLLESYMWPGNVQELQNVMERACALSSGPVLRSEDLPSQIAEHRNQQQALDAPAGSAGPSEIRTIADIERSAILGTLRQLNGDKIQAARLLGIGKTTLYRKLKEYGVAEDSTEYMTDPSP